MTKRLRPIVIDYSTNWEQAYRQNIEQMTANAGCDLPLEIVRARIDELIDHAVTFEEFDRELKRLLGQASLAAPLDAGRVPKRPSGDAR